MNNTNETNGLKVLSISPLNKASDVNVNSNISIGFSADIDLGTLIKNIVVLEDINHIYKNIESLKDYSKFAVTKGNITYDNRVVTYIPTEPFNTDATYIIILNDEITDITNNKLVKKYVSCFYTEKVASYPPCEFTSPKYGSICSSIPLFSWKNQKSESYEFQISKTNTFETYIVDEMIAGNPIDEVISYQPEFNLMEGMYHIRVKSENGEWSNVHQIFIKAITDSVVAKEDTPILKSFTEFIDDIYEPIEILEIFPSPNDTNISLKTATFYIKIKGKVEENRIDFPSAFVYGEYINIEEDNDEEKSHEFVDGEWIWLYDSYNDVTYLIFKVNDNSNNDSSDSDDNYNDSDDDYNDSSDDSNDSDDSTDSSDDSSN